MAEQRVGLKAIVSADMTQFAATMRRASSMAQKTAAKISNGMKAGAASIGRAAMTAGKLTAALAGVGASLALRAALKGAANLETLTVAFRTLVGDAALADKTLKEIRDLGASTPFEFPELAGAGRNLIAFGVAAEEVTETLGMIGDVSAGVGANVGEIAEIFGKARVAGTLYAEDINQLVGRGIPVIQEFAKQLGVSESEVKKMASQGQVTFPMLEKAFANLTSEGGKFFGMMEAQSQTAAGKMSTLRDNISNALTEFGAPINSALLPFLDKAIAYVNELTPKMQQLGETIGSMLSQNMDIGSVANLLGSALSDAMKFAMEAGYTFFRALFSYEGLSFLGESIVNVFKSIGQALADVLVEAFDRVTKQFGEWDDWAFEDPLPDDKGAAFLKNIKDEMGSLKFGFSDKTKGLFKDLTGDVNSSASQSTGQTSEADLYEAERKRQKERVAAEAATFNDGLGNFWKTIDATLAQRKASQISATATKMAGHHQAGFSGLAGLEQMQLQRMRGDGPGKSGVFSNDRARLGIGSGLTSGGLGEKRAVGNRKSEEDLKKQAELAKSSEEHLMDIKTEIKSALTVTS